MDKLAPAITWLKENGFWLANGLLLLLMIGIWYLQTGNLNEATKKNESKITQEFNMAQTIKRKKPEDLKDDIAPLHPNRTTQDGMQAELERTVNSIIAAWKVRVDAQKKLLVFPAVIGNKEFSEVFGPYNPPETFPEEYADFGTIDPLLGLYKRKIQEHMINICGKDGVRTNWFWDPANDYSVPEKSSSSSGKDDGPAVQIREEDPSRFAVLWSSVNQQLWHDKLTKFQGRDDHNKERNEPTPLQCYMLQQDLWVLEAMFNVIRGLNGDSTATDTSSIKQIAHIGIGREGATRLGKLHAIDSRFAPKLEASATATSAAPLGNPSSTLGSTGNTAGGASGFELYFSEEVLTPGAGLNEAAGSADGSIDGVTEKLPPFHEMYVDTKFEPISSKEVLEVVKGEALSDTNLELLIAKRLPVRIGLRMDERKIPDFMAACTNSPFSYEIQQVRINRHQPDGDFIPLGGDDSVTATSGSADSGNDILNFDKVSHVETRVNYDVDVEFFGIIKIYNPVRADLIRKAAGLPEQPAVAGNPEDANSAGIQDDLSRVRNAG